MPALQFTSLAEMHEYYWNHNPKNRFKRNGEKHLHKAAHRSIVAILVEFIAANGEIAGPRTVRILIDYFTRGLTLAELAMEEGLTEQRVFWLINSALERYRKAAQQYNFFRDAQMH